MHALLLTGRFGAGKTAVAAEISHQLGQRGIRNAALDLDWLCWVGPDITGDPLTALLQRNLRDVVRNLRDAGVERVVMARALTSRADRRAVEDALPDATQLVVVHLRVGDSTALERVTGRDSGSELDELLSGGGDIARAVASARVEDDAVDNDGSRPVVDVAVEVLERCGWLAPDVD